jgi:hypothetical protein
MRLVMLVLFFTLSACGENGIRSAQKHGLDGHETGSGDPNESGMRVLMYQAVLQDPQVHLSLNTDVDRPIDSVTYVEKTVNETSYRSLIRVQAGSCTLNVTLEHESTVSEGGRFIVKNIDKACL